MTDRKVDPDIFIEIDGKKISFCCEICRAEFESDPKLYAGNLPASLEDISVETSKPASPDQSRLALKWRHFHTLPIWSPADYFSGVPYWPFLLLFVALVTLWAFTIGSKLGTDRRYLKVRTAAHCTVYLVLLTFSVQCLLIAMAYRQISHENAAAYSGLGFTSKQAGVSPQAARMHQEMHYHFGNPPEPPFPSDSGPALFKTYYRGNDERSPDLFNGGNYLTCTFEVGVVDKHGNAVAQGSRRPEQCFVHLTIIRAPFTADVLYSDRIMEQVFATEQYELSGLLTAPDRVNLKAVENDWKWELNFPIDPEVDSGEIYLWHVNLWGGDSVPLLHYAIHYDLPTESGVLTESADIRLGALRLTTPVIRYQMPIEEWLRSTPFPELESPGPADPKKLGIDEHVKNAE